MPKTEEASTDGDESNVILVDDWDDVEFKIHNAYSRGWDESDPVALQMALYESGETEVEIVESDETKTVIRKAENETEDDS